MGKGGMRSTGALKKYLEGCCVTQFEEDSPLSGHGEWLPQEVLWSITMSFAGGWKTKSQEHQRRDSFTR